ncbi:hypothetical protein ACHAPT_003114 [Fusarium lateritium]
MCIMVGKRPWSDLFGKHTFFTQGYKYYISVVSSAKTKEGHTIWSGYVESKVRMLVQKLEQHPSIALAHAFNKGYERHHQCRNDQEIAAVQDGSLEYLSAEKTEETPVAKSEPAVAELPIKAETEEDSKPVKSEPESAESDGTVKAEAVKAEPSGEVKLVAAGVTDVYTTTHYIGLELSGGMS